MIWDVNQREAEQGRLLCESRIETLSQKPLVSSKRRRNPTRLIGFIPRLTIIASLCAISFSALAFNCSRLDRNKFLTDAQISFGDVIKIVGCGIYDDVCNFEIDDICVISHSKDLKFKNVVSILCKRKFIENYSKPLNAFIENTTRAEFDRLQIFLDADRQTLNGSCYNARSRSSSTRLGVLQHISFDER